MNGTLKANIDSRFTVDQIQQAVTQPYIETNDSQPQRAVNLWREFTTA
mgnify:FL=1